MPIGSQFQQQLNLAGGNLAFFAPVVGKSLIFSSMSISIENFVLVGDQGFELREVLEIAFFLVQNDQAGIFTL